MKRRMIGFVVVVMLTLLIGGGVVDMRLRGYRQVEVLPPSEWGFYDVYYDGFCPDKSGKARACGDHEYAVGFLGFRHGMR